MIVTKFLCPTNTKGSRIKVSSGTESKTYAWKYNLSTTENHEAAFLRFLADVMKKDEPSEWVYNCSRMTPALLSSGKAHAQ